MALLAPPARSLTRRSDRAPPAPRRARCPPTPARQRLFEEFAKRTTSIMCCTWSPKLNGYVHYDWFWDVLPHTDRKGRTFTQEWVPTYGDSQQRLSDCSFDFAKGKDASHPQVTCGLDQRPL